jgi:hypothetical protein
MFGHPEIFLSDLEASRVEVNNGYFFSALRQHGGEIPASAAENKNVVVSTQTAKIFIQDVKDRRWRTASNSPTITGLPALVCASTGAMAI